jgi:hypothetical protein
VFIGSFGLILKVIQFLPNFKPLGHVRCIIYGKSGVVAQKQCHKKIIKIALRTIYYFCASLLKTLSVHNEKN